MCTLIGVFLTVSSGETKWTKTVVVSGNVFFNTLPS
ncbi:unnamed protein product [Brugia timori]|uniref:Uncharacterized protein n=1 Tax=Brugia timori TaxID=42155 RepID=A0A3P7WJL6_9BILA|nr:unnamed protein product [Brugia timori]